MFRTTAPGVQQRIQAPPQLPQVRPKKEVCCYLSSFIGFLGLFVIGGCFFGIAAVVLGIIGQIRVENDPNLRGKWEGRAGVALGVISLIIAAAKLQHLTGQ